MHSRVTLFFLLAGGALGATLPNYPRGHRGWGKAGIRPQNNSTPTTTTTTASGAAPTGPAADSNGASNGNFNVKTYYGGDNFPFTLSQDQAPKMQGSDYVDLHNQYRALHGAQPVVLNQTLVDAAQQFVQGCPDDDPQNAPGYGSNFIFGPNDDHADNMWWWYNERGNFTAMSQDYTVLTHNDGYQATAANGQKVTQPMTMHFTAMVWNSTKTIGCAMKSGCFQNGYSGYVHVCLYYPPGNLVDDQQMLEYKKDVFKPSR